MELASLIISVIAFLIASASLIWHLAKQLSTHQIQMVPVDPFKGMESIAGNTVGSPMAEAFRELGDPIEKEELERLEAMRAKKGKMT